MRRPCLLLPFLLLAGCSAPSDSAASYPQNPAISDTQGHPRDSTTFYFPAADSSYIPVDPITAQTESFPPKRLQFASCNLLHLGAPILSNNYGGEDIYRFLWLRSFHRPVLLTLTRQENRQTVRTQFLSKPACGPRMVSILFIPPGTPATQARKQQQQFDAQPPDSALIAANRPPVQITAEETVQPISRLQWQHFQQLLLASKFQQLPSYEESGANDGAYWLLEAHQASGYHMVFRHSPDKQEGFRKACEYLLDLSSARHEERY
jgi:hypothetical protein